MAADGSGLGSREERDRSLIYALSQRARDARGDLREWITEELKDLIYRAEHLEPQVVGEGRSDIIRILTRLRSINNDLLDDTLRRIDDRVADVRARGYPDISDLRSYLGELLGRLEDIVRELRRARATLDAHEEALAFGR